MTHIQNDVFKQEFKYYKANQPPPSLLNVLNICNTDNGSDSRIHHISDYSLNKDHRTCLLGVTDTKDWKIYSIPTNPGLLLIKNPFTSCGQRYWIRKCLQCYTKKPNRTNIDNEVQLEDWWAECYKDMLWDKVLLKKMRWTTLGYHHNWDTKVYNEDEKDVFPEDLAELCDVVANAIGYNKFKPQAAIINYYHMGSTLSPHTDHSEMNLEAPLFSFSFGQSAIFLIGGTDKSQKPTSILLNSGDIIVMTKEARLCYHAVPKILPASSAPWDVWHDTVNPTDDIVLPSNVKYISCPIKLHTDVYNNSSNTEWEKLNTYISQSRININVRQVLNETQNNLYDNNNVI